MRDWRIILFAAVWCGASTLNGAESAEALFRDTVQPALKQQCLGCHGDGNLFGELDLRSREGLIAGGSRGPAIVPGDASGSLLYRTLDHSGELQMPPTAKLPADMIAAIGAWIDGGAPFAEAADSGASDWGRYLEEDVWAFRPVAKVEAGGIDELLDRKLAEAEQVAASRADRPTLIRRATIDLTGLPPTPEEVKAFVEDPASEDVAFETVVDRLLASERYGERWGRHWLDVTRYADTGGFSNDYERPNAWRYRDYVIRSFNEDKPYDRFVLEQIAGDELYPDDPDAILATGFLRMGPWEHTGMSVTAVTRQQWLDDVTHSTATVFLGLTLGCAKCHDHKFDPISHARLLPGSRRRLPQPLSPAVKVRLSWTRSTADGFEQGAEARIRARLSLKLEAKLAEIR